jgi:hypothetical protein
MRALLVSQDRRLIFVTRWLRANSYSWIGDGAGSGVGLSYRHACLCILAGRYDNPMPEAASSPSEGLRIRLLISNGGRFKPAFAKRDWKQTVIDLRGISTNWFKNQLCPSIRLSRMRALNLGQQATPGGGGTIGLKVTMNILDSNYKGKLQYRTKRPFLRECGIAKTGVRCG